MRLVLLYPPPWRIGDVAAPREEGPPSEYREGDLDADFHQIPYGLLSLARVVSAAGHQVKLLNLSAFAWYKVERVVGELTADVFGLSCYTANRRGVASVARLIRARHPSAHLVVGGPHATALPVELLAHHPALDSVVVGEGETTLLELLARLGDGRDLAGLAGAVYRRAGKIERGAPRPLLRDLDQLPSVHEQFPTHVIMTSRGCPWRCTFCAADTLWGQKLRLHSVPYVVENVRQALGRLPVKMLLFKDDTFTAQRRRALELLRELRAQQLTFVWSCDTRADALDAELVRELRLAGCQRVSLGVESGSPTVLRNVDKRIDLDSVRRATALCKEVGLQVRFFMMLGNRGETADTLRETLGFLQEVRPHQAIFACLSVYPGTRDYRELVSRGWLDPEVYFKDDFQELKAPFDATPEDARLLGDWFEQHRGLLEFYREGAREYRAVLERVGDHWGAHLDLAGAYYEVGDFPACELHVRRAIELGHPCPGLAHNYLACIRARTKDYDGMVREFDLAAADGQHWVVARNRVALAEWQQRGGSASASEPDLAWRHDFRVLERPEQPMLPGPLPADYARWAMPPRRPP